MQVAGTCQDRAELMSDVWQSYSGMADSIIKRLVDQHSGVQQKWVVCLHPTLD